MSIKIIVNGINSLDRFNFLLQTDGIS